MTYFLIFAILGLLILIHEAGHLAAAKCARIPIERFSVGFGPKLWGFSRNGTEYRFSAFPFGGYVLPRIGSVEEFSKFPLPGRILFSLGGPAANLAAAFACISVAGAAGSGISTWSVLVAPALELYKTAVQIVSAIPAFFDHPERLSGIVGIVAAGGQYAAADLTRLLNFSIMLNVNLAIFNLLPLPPLDGGRIVFSVFEKIYKPLERLQMPVTVAGWALMALLMLYTGVMDIGRLITRVQI